MFRPLRHYADFKGRAARSEYWLFILFSWALFGAVAGIGMALGWRPLTPALQWRIIPAADASMLDKGVFAALMVLLALIIVPTLAVQVRRFHDRGNSAWMLVWHVIPYIGEFVLFFAMVMPGTIGPNRYGRDPTDPLDEDGFVIGTRLPLDHY